MTLTKKERVLEILSTGPKTIREVSEVLGCLQNSLTGAFDSLCRSGQIEKAGKTNTERYSNINLYQLNESYTPPKAEPIEKPKKSIKELALEFLEKGDATANMIAKELDAHPKTIGKYMGQYWEQGLVFRAKIKAMNAFIYSLEDKPESEFFLVDDEDERIVRKPAHFSYEGKNNWLGVWF